MQMTHFLLATTEAETILEEVTTELQTTEQTTEVIGEALAETVEEASKLMQQLENMIPSVINFGIDVLIAILIFFVGKSLIRVLLKISNRFFDRANVDIGVRKFLISLIRALLYVVLVITICGQLGIETTSFIAVIGSAGLAVGLAFQGSLSNLAGGVLILVLKPFTIGDYIIESGTGREGTVQQIDICYTTLLTVDNKKIVIPNGTLSNSTITNASAMETRRVDISIGIGYGCDIAKAKALMEQIAGECNTVLKDKEIFTFVDNLDASCVTLGLRVWSRNSDYWTTKFYLMETIKNEFDKHGIEIPFNQLVVHLEK